jgi:hypothetical protein
MRILIPEPKDGKSVSWILYKNIKRKRDKNDAARRDKEMFRTEEHFPAGRDFPILSFGSANAPTSTQSYER